MGNGGWGKGDKGELLNKFFPCLPPLPCLPCLFPMPNAQCPSPSSILVIYIAQQYVWQTLERALLISLDDFASHINNSE